MNIDYLCYDKSKEISQCFLIRKNKLKTYELYNVLFQFCKTDLQVNANLKKLIGSIGKVERCHGFGMMMAILIP